MKRSIPRFLFFLVNIALFMTFWQIRLLRLICTVLIPTEIAWKLYNIACKVFLIGAPEPNGIVSVKKLRHLLVIVKFHKLLHWQLIEQHDVSPLHSNVCVFSLLVYPFSNFGQMPKKKRIKQACLDFFWKNHDFLSRKTSTFLKIRNFRISKNIDFPKNRKFQKIRYTCHSRI